ncbi:hypothetical protein ACFL35_19965 [Candidatus Riflebacteria bacterium]
MANKTKVKSRELQKTWTRHLNNWQKSGVSQRQFCQQNKLKFHRFVYWRKKIPVKNKNRINFVPVETDLSIPEKITFKQHSSGIVIFVNDIKIEIEESFNPKTLAGVVKVLSKAHGF